MVNNKKVELLKENLETNNKKDNKNISSKTVNDPDIRKPVSKDPKYSRVNRIEILITLSLIITIIAMLIYNLYSVSMSNSKISGRIERHEILELQQIEKQNAKDATREWIELGKLEKSEINKAIIGFDKKYAEIENNYYKDIEDLNNKLSDYVVNVSELKRLTAQVVLTTKNFKVGFDNLYMIVPEPLYHFYELKKRSIEINIEAWDLTLQYYSGEIEKDIVDEKHKESSDLFKKTVEERITVYGEYGLEILLK